MEKKKPHLCFVFFFLLLCAEISEGKRRVSIEDDLSGVVDEEEDEAWKQWGTKRKHPSSDPPLDLNKMSPSEIQAETMRRHTGPSLGFVKLRLGVRRSADGVSEIAMKWSKVLRTGSIEVKFMAVDLTTIMFTLERGQDLEELKGFILSQVEAYEVKIGEQLYRRPGDPPLDEVAEQLHRERSWIDSHDPTEEQQHLKVEL